MNWNFKIQVNFLGFYFEVHVDSHDIQTSIIMHYALYEYRLVYS